VHNKRRAKKSEKKRTKRERRKENREIREAQYVRLMIHASTYFLVGTKGG
jgi:lipid II:glycine glycyltransferase (peptidoglycan interpeptide bridge formation enzyme)